MVLGWRRGAKNTTRARSAQAVGRILLASVVLLAEPASAETLREALTLAYRTNPKLDAQRARQRATDEDVPRAKSGYRPRASASVDTGQLRLKTIPESTSVTGR
ncbi:MAG: hypothetical protein KGP27_13220 [Hyphomicrobiales bacterium]|nr:hypothetical protein [Hyphomicrobiales bacterium]